MGIYVTKRAHGLAMEAAAADYLARQGVKVIARNFRIRGGEIDLVCEEGNTIVFVEVRSRRRKDYGSAAESISWSKRKRLILAARGWLMRHGMRACRFDCVLFDGGRLTWIKNAFSADLD
ncbi:MAG: YraN family protein [Rhodocyclaceae bacterium]|nr:YraN family protein [Rhodocyclaceae bacterium]